jgi:hypothetical protein
MATETRQLLERIRTTLEQAPSLAVPAPRAAA